MQRKTGIERFAWAGTIDYLVVYWGVGNLKQHIGLGYNENKREMDVSKKKHAK